MPDKYQETLQQILEAATTEPRENLVNRMKAIISGTTDPVAPVLAMGAICYGRANTDDNLNDQEIEALKSLCETAKQRASKSPNTPEAALAEGSATLFKIVADQGAGMKLTAAEHQKTVVEAHAKIKRAEKGNNELFDVLSAAAQRFFPAMLRERKTKDEAVNRLIGLAKLNGPEGTLARLLFAEHLVRRGQAKGLNAVAQRLGQELPNAACVQTFQATAALGTGNLAAVEEHLAKAFQLNRHDKTIRRAYAQILRANGKNDKAQEIEAG